MSARTEQLHLFHSSQVQCEEAATEVFLQIYKNAFEDLKVKDDDGFHQFQKLRSYLDKSSGNAT